jgi:hypothetical protein
MAKETTISAAPGGRALLFSRAVKTRSWNLGALTRRVTALDGKKEEDRIEGEELSAKMLSLFQDMKNENDPSLDAIALTTVYQVLGVFNCGVGTKCCIEMAKHYAEKARDVNAASSGVPQCQITEALESEIDKIEAMLRGESPHTANNMSTLRSRYNWSLRFNGENHAVTILIGVQLAKALFVADIRLKLYGVTQNVGCN